MNDVMDRIIKCANCEYKPEVPAPWRSQLAKLGPFEDVVGYYEEHGYGDHGAQAIARLPDGRWVYAECSGCSCGGQGDYRVEDTRELILRHVTGGRIS